MNVVIVTPLYPPDVAEPAPYSKELARRLAAMGYAVTVLAYGSIPESLSGVQVRLVRKQLPIPLRLISFTYKLWRVRRTSDLIIIENGQSVEVPAYVALLFCSKPGIFHIGDERAMTRSSKNAFLIHIQESLAKRFGTVHDTPTPRPEILPLEQYPTEALREYELSWTAYLQKLQTLSYGK